MPTEKLCDACLTLSVFTVPSLQPGRTKFREREPTAKDERGNQSARNARTAEEQIVTKKRRSLARQRHRPRPGRRFSVASATPSTATLYNTINRNRVRHHQPRPCTARSTANLCARSRTASGVLLGIGNMLAGSVFVSRIGLSNLGIRSPGVRSGELADVSLHGGT